MCEGKNLNNHRVKIAHYYFTTRKVQPKNRPKPLFYLKNGRKSKTFYNPKGENYLIMNIEFLAEIFDDKETDYYIVEKWNKPLLVGVPTAIKQERMYFSTERRIDDQSWKKIKSMLKIPIDSNLDLTGKHAPFQMGLTVGCVERFRKVDCSLKLLLEQTPLKGKKCDFFAYAKLIEDIKKEQELKATKNNTP